MARMKADAQRLYRLEAAASGAPWARKCLKALQSLITTPLRLLYELYGRDKWSAESVEGRRHLATTLIFPPDNKIVEDLHQHIRDLARLGRSVVSTCPARFKASVESGVLEGRGISHRRVTESAYRRGYKRKFGKWAHKFIARRHRLPRRLLPYFVD